MAHTLQPFMLVTKAIEAQIPHGVTVEGTIVGVQLMPLPSEFPTRRTGTRARLGKRQPTTAPDTKLLMMKFCDIKQINFAHLPPGDGKQLKAGAVVRIKGLDSIVAKALNGKCLTRSRRLNIRAKFYANGALNVKFLSLAH